MFKKILMLSLTAVFLFSCQSKTEKYSTVKLEPSEPRQGSVVTVIYDASGTVLKDAKKVYMTAYQFSSEVEDAKKIEMSGKEGKWTAKLPVSKKAIGIIMKFSEEKTVDNNNDKGYVFQVYDKDGNKVPGLKAGLAVAYSGWIQNLGIDPDRAKAYELFKEAFKENPSIKRAFIVKYLPVLIREEKSNPQEKLTAELAEVEKYPNLTDKELSILVDMYGNLGNQQKFIQYQNESLKRFPKGEVAQKTEYRNSLQHPDVQTILSFERRFPHSDFTEGLIYTALKNFIARKDFKGAAKFLEALKDYVHPYYFSYVVGKILDNNADLKVAEKIARLGIERAKEVASQPDSAKPKDITMQDWQLMNKYYLGRNFTEYGKVLYDMGKKAKALEVLQNAFELIEKDYRDPQAIELYAKLLVEQKKYEQAKVMIEEMIKDGSATHEMKKLLKKAYVGINKSDAGYAAYLAALEGKANEKMLEELKKKMIDEPAPNFTLKDLDGKNVSLSDFKGKIVIVDFWATWCNPCLKSFPGMKLTIEKFKDDKDVAFLFINTWERVNDKFANARKFIQANNYPFHVLIDDQNKVVTDFKVSGIPTKFILGKDGNIKFKSVGFSGTAEHLENELSAMISLLK